MRRARAVDEASSWVGVGASLWRPEEPVSLEEAVRIWFYAGVGRKP